MPLLAVGVRLRRAAPALGTLGSHAEAPGRRAGFPATREAEAASGMVPGSRIWEKKIPS